MCIRDRAYDGIQAVEIMKNKKIDLMIIDVMMPKLDGIRATLQIRKESRVPDVYKRQVTACPTGIAHTYMAAEAIERKAKELGYQVKVETREMCIRDSL